MEKINARIIKCDNRKIAIANIFYYLAIILLTIKTIDLSSQLIKIDDSLQNLIFLSAIFLIGVKLILTNVSVKFAIIVLIMGIVCLYGGVVTKSYHIFMTYLVIIGSYKSDKRVLIKLITYTISFMVFIHMIVYLIAYIFSTVDVNTIAKGSRSIQTHSFYLGHSNTASMYILWSILGIIYLKYRKVNKIQLLFYIILISIIYFFTRSRTMILLGGIAILLIYVDKYIIIKQSKLIDLFCKYGYIIGSIGIILLCIFYRSIKNIRIIDTLFTGRLMLANFALEKYGITFFGRMIDYTKNYGEISNWSITRLTIDIMPLRLLINYGVFYIIIYSIILLITTKWMSRCEKIFVFLMIINGFLEIFTINAIICFPLAICGWYFVNSKNYRYIKGKRIEVNKGGVI